MVTGAGLAAEATVGTVNLGVEAVKLAAHMIMRAVGTGYSGAASTADFIDRFMSRFGAADQAAIRAELERSGFSIPSLRGAPARAPPAPPRPRPPPRPMDVYDYLDVAAKVPGLHVPLAPYAYARAAGRGYRAIDDYFRGARRRGDDEL